MEKTTVYLTTQQKAALAAAARAQGRSEARLIRDGIEGLVGRHQTGELVAPPRAAPTAGQMDDERRIRPRWISRDAFLRELVPVQADPLLTAELREMAPDTTADLPDR